MATNGNTNQEKAFPFKTLIWAVVSVTAILIFKAELKDLLGRAEKLTVFGIEVKTSETEASALRDTIMGYQSNISSLTQQFVEQQKELDEIASLNLKLAESAAKCPETRKASEQLNSKIKKAEFDNNILTSQIKIISNKDILKLRPG